MEKEALTAISEFVVAGALEGFCQKYGVYFHPDEPPYLTMARIAAFTLKTPVDTVAA